MMPLHSVSPVCVCVCVNLLYTYTQCHFEQEHWLNAQNVNAGVSGLVVYLHVQRFSFHLFPLSLSLSLSHYVTGFKDRRANRRVCN